MSTCDLGSDWLQQSVSANQRLAFCGQVTQIPGGPCVHPLCGPHHDLHMPPWLQAEPQGPPRHDPDPEAPCAAPLVTGSTPTPSCPRSFLLLHLPPLHCRYQRTPARNTHARTHAQLPVSRTNARASRWRAGIGAPRRPLVVTGGGAGLPRDNNKDVNQSESAPTARR